MSLFLSPDNPAFPILVREGWDVRPPSVKNSFRALKILFINQMPSEVKTATDAQWARLLAATPYPVHLTIAVPDGSSGKHAGPFVRKNYQPVYPPFWTVKDDPAHAVIVSGAPHEKKSLEEIKTWFALQEIYNWSEKNTVGSLFICWAAQMALYHYHQIEKQLAKTKLFGVYAQELLQPPRSDFAMSLALNLANTSLEVPVSRLCYANRHEIHRKAPHIDIILDSGETHPGLLYDDRHNRLYSFNHPEYDRRTIGDEYIRDRDKNENVEPPHHYDLDQLDNENPPDWRPIGNIIVNHWLWKVAERCNDFQI